MSHEMTTTDGLMVVGTPAWHGLGVVVPDAASPDEALKVAGLDWSVESCPIIAERERFHIVDGRPISQVERIAGESYRANVRSDTGEVLAVVGAGYQAVQNRDLAALMYAAAESDAVTVETFGSFRGGRVVYACAHLDTFELPGNDRVHSYALFSNAHDGSRSLWVLPTTVRVVCSNTHAWATGGRGERFRGRHTSGLMDRVGEVRAVLANARKVGQASEARARVLQARSMTEDEVRRFFTAVWAREFGAIPTGAQLDKGERRKRDRAVRDVSSWLGRMRDEAEYLNTEPNAWLATNAVAWWSDHERTTRGGERMASAVLGTGAATKARTYARAEALAEAS